MHSASTSDLRKNNRQLVLRLLAQAGSATRTELAEQANLTSAAISRITRELIDADLLEEMSCTPINSGRGRRTQTLKFTSHGAWLIVMVISANKRVVALASTQGKICDTIELDCLELNPAAAALDKYASCVNELIKRNNICRSRVLGISILVAINTKPTDNGKITSAVLGWKQVPVVKHIAEKTALPIHIEARAVGLLQSELWKTTNHKNSCHLLVNNGWRLGSCAFLDNQLLENTSARLGQISHYSLPGNTSPCYCGQAGCLDALASGAAIVNSLCVSHPDLFPLQQPALQKLEFAIKLADSNRDISNTFKQAGRFLGLGLNALNSIFSPQHIYLAGNTCRQKHYIEGVKSGFVGKMIKKPLNKANSSNACTVSISNTRSIEAATRTGLEAFLFSSSLNLKQFQNDALSA